MVIKVQRYFLLGIIILAIIFILPAKMIYQSSVSKNSNIESPETNATNIVDKVYTFLAPEDTLEFQDMALKKDFTYYIFVQVVTSHNCELNISVWDPNGGLFKIFSRPLTLNDTIGSNQAEIPFGTAMAGNYTLRFNVILEMNMNIYIRIQEGQTVFRDKMTTDEWDNRIFYRVTKFYDGMYIEHNIQLESDVNYKVYLGRVSPIANENLSIIRANHSLIDKNNIEFIIYSDDLIAGVLDLNSYTFGTAIAGIYRFKLQIHCQVEFINLAYTVIDLYDISEGSDTNHTGIPNNNTNYESGKFSLPMLVLTGLATAMISIIIILTVFVYHRKNRQSKELNITEF
jgi:hypothetical protein